MAELPDKAHWQQDFKRRYGVPDGLARGVKMGDRFEWWRQTETRLGPAKDWMGLFTQIDTLIRDMQIYAQALKMADPNKFKAENGFGKVKNYEQAIHEFNLLLVEATRKKHIYETLAKPLLGAQYTLGKAREKISTLNEHSPQELWQEFNRNEFRDIGTKLRLLAQVTDPGIKDGIAGFKHFANKLNTIVDSKPFDGKAVYDYALRALERLAEGIEGK
jgi:hypothetical protein